MAADPLDAARRRVGRMLGEHFLPTQVAAALAGEVNAAVRAGLPLRLGIEVADPDADAGTGRQHVDPLAALADARRAVEAERAGLPASDRRAALAEWATPALFLRGPSLPLFDPSAGFEKSSNRRGRCWPKGSWGPGRSRVTVR